MKGASIEPDTIYVLFLRDFQRILFRAIYFRDSCDTPKSGAFIREAK